MGKSGSAIARSLDELVGNPGGKVRRESRVDLVHFEGLYQVHHPWPKSPSEPHLVYLVHPLKEDLVHLGMKTTVAGGAGILLCSW